MDTEKQTGLTAGGQIPAARCATESSQQGSNMGNEIDTSISQVRLLCGKWLAGKIGSLNFCARIYQESSKFGINGGNVSKLSVWLTYGPMVINYDRGWDIKPQNAEEEKIVDAILDYCRRYCDKRKGSQQTPID